VGGEGGLHGGAAPCVRRGLKCDTLARERNQGGGVGMVWRSAALPPHSLPPTSPTYRGGHNSEGGHDNDPDHSGTSLQDLTGGEIGQSTWGGGGTPNIPTGRQLISTPGGVPRHSRLQNEKREGLRPIPPHPPHPPPRPPTTRTHTPRTCLTLKTTWAPSTSASSSKLTVMALPVGRAVVNMDSNRARSAARSA
jgi:hypothetical protein